MTSDHTTISEHMARLTALRERIDNIDAALIYMLAERFRCTEEVGTLKASSRLPACDPAREEQQLARLHHLAADAGLDIEFTDRFFTFLVGEVIANHKAIAARQQDEN